MRSAKTLIQVKSISAMVVMAFALQQLACAAPTGVFENSIAKPLNFSIAKDVAHVDEVYEGLAKNPRLILIQDAHTNVSGQLNIAEALSEFISKHKVKFVFTEAGMGDNSLTALRDSAPEKIRKQIGLEYLRKGKLKGTEYLSLASGLDFTIWGVEDPDLYSESFDAYKSIVASRNATLPQLNALISTSHLLKEKIFNYELRNFDSLRLNYLNEKVEVSEYIQSLSSHLSDQELNSFKTFKSLKDIQSAEKNINFQKSDVQRRELISEYAKEWKYLNSNINSSGSFNSPLESIRKKGEEFNYQIFKKYVDSLIADGHLTRAAFNARYRNLSEYMRYADRAFNLDMRTVVEEIESVESFVYNKLTHSEDERDLIDADVHLQIYKKLIEMKATPNEYRRIRNYGEDAGYRRTVGVLNRLLMKLQEHYDKTGFLNNTLRDSILTSLSFYRLAGSRDLVFLKEALEKIKNEDESIAVLVTGGFHAPNLTEILRDRKISYVSIQPQVSHETDHGRYERMLLRQDVSSSWKQRVVASKSSIASDSAYSMDLLNVVVRDPVEINQLKLALGIPESAPFRQEAVSAGITSSSEKTDVSVDRFERLKSATLSASRLAKRISGYVRAFIAKHFLKNVEGFLKWLTRSEEEVSVEENKISHIYSEISTALQEQHHGGDLSRITIDSSVHSGLFAENIAPNQLRYVFAEILKNAFDEPITGQVKISAEESEDRIAIDVDNQGEVDWAALWFTFLDKLTDDRLYIDTETFQYRAGGTDNLLKKSERIIGLTELFVLRNAHRFVDLVKVQDGKVVWSEGASESIDTDSFESYLSKGEVSDDLIKKIIATLSDEQLNEYFENMPFGILNEASKGRMWKSSKSNSLIILNSQPDQKEYIPYSLSSFMVDHAESIPHINVLPLIQQVTRAGTPIQGKEQKKIYGGLGVGLFVSARLLIEAGGDIQIVSLPKGGTRTKIILNKFSNLPENSFNHSPSKKIQVDLNSDTQDRFIFENAEMVRETFNQWPSNEFTIDIQEDSEQRLSFWLTDKDQDKFALRLLYDEKSKTASIDFFTVQGPIVGEQLGIDTYILSVDGIKRSQIQEFLKYHFFPKITKLLREIQRTKSDSIQINELRISHDRSLVSPIDFADLFMEDDESRDLVFRIGQFNAGARLALDSNVSEPVRKDISEANLRDQIIVRVDSRGEDIVYLLHANHFGYWMAHRMEDGKSAKESDVLITKGVSSESSRIHNSDLFGDVRFKKWFSDPEVNLSIYAYNGFAEDGEMERIESEGLGTVFRNIPIHRMIQILSQSKQFGVNWDDIPISNLGEDSTSYTSVAEWAFSGIFPSSPNQDFSKYIFAVFPQGTFEEQSSAFNPVARIGTESNPIIENFNNSAKNQNRILEYTTKPSTILNFRHALLISDSREAEVLRLAKPRNRDEALQALNRSEEDQQKFETQVLSELTQSGARLANQDTVRIRQIFQEENIEIPLLKGEELSQRLDQTTVVIMAGGKGTRLQRGHKPTLKIGDLSLLDRTLNGLEVLGVQKAVIIGPEDLEGIDWPQSSSMQIEIKPREGDDFHTSASKAVEYVRDFHQSDQVMILSGDNLFHMKSTAEALYGKNTRAVIVAENRGDQGLQIKTNRFGSVKSYEVDYSGDGPYPVGWFIPISDAGTLAESVESNDANLKGLERLLAENYQNFNAVRAFYDPDLDYSFNLNRPDDFNRLNNWVKSNQRAYGDIHDLKKEDAVYKVIESADGQKESWAEVKNQIQRTGFSSIWNSVGFGFIALASLISWIMLDIVTAQIVFSNTTVDSLNLYSFQALFFGFSMMLSVSSLFLAMYTSLNSYIGARILISEQGTYRSELLSDESLPSLTIVAPIKNEAPDVVRRTLQSAFESGYPEGKLQILLVSGYGAGERNDVYHEQYLQIIQELDPEGNVLRLVEADQSLRGSTEVLVNGKSYNLNHVLLNPNTSADEKIQGEYFSIADADSYFAPGILREAMSSAMRQRNESTVETGIIQFRRTVDSGSDVDYGHFFTTMRQNLHDIVLDNFVTPLRFNSGFVGNFGHGNLISTQAAVEVGGFTETQKIEDLDIAMKLRESGYRVLYNNDISLDEGITLGGSGFFTRAGKIARGDMNLFREWVHEVVFSQKFSLTEKGHTLVHLIRGLGTFALMFASIMIPTLFLFNDSVYFGNAAYVITTVIFYLTVFPSIYFIHSQPVIVGPVIIKLLFSGRFLQAADIFLTYPMQYVYLLATNPIMGLTSLKVALTGKIEVFTPTQKTSDDVSPDKSTSDSLLKKSSIQVIDFMLEKTSFLFSIAIIATTIALFPAATALPIGIVLGAYLMTSFVYTNFFRDHVMRPQDNTGARLTDSGGSRLSDGLQSNQFDQEVIQERRERIKEFLREHISDSVSGSWNAYISRGLQIGKQRAIPVGTIRNDLRQIGRTDPEAVIDIASGAIVSSFEDMSASREYVREISADAMSLTFVAMFQLSDNADIVMQRLREVVRQNIPDVYEETGFESNEYRYKSDTDGGARLSRDFIESASKYNANGWSGYSDQVLKGLTDEERYLFVERIANEFNSNNVQGVYIDPTVRTQDLASWARRDASTALDVQLSNGGTLELNIRGLFPAEITEFQQLYDAGIRKQPITVQHDSYSSSGMGYTESTVYRNFFNSVPGNFDGIRRVDQIATRYVLKMVVKELYRQGYNFGFKIDSCCWGAADLSRDIVIGEVYPIQGDGLSYRQGSRTIQLIRYLSMRFAGETGEGADISRPGYVDSGTIDDAGGKWDYTTTSYLKRYFDADPPQPDFERITDDADDSKVLTSSARLAASSGEVIEVVPKNQLVNYSDIQSMLNRLQIPIDKKAVFIGAGNPIIRYGAAPIEYENPFPLIRWEFHLLNLGLPVEIYEPSYLGEWYQKTDSALGRYKSGMNAFGSYIDADSQKDSVGFASASSFFTDGPGNVPDSVKDQAAKKIAQTLTVGGYLHLAHYISVDGEKARSDRWQQVIEQYLEELGKRLVLTAQGYEDPEAPLAHNWQIFRVESISDSDAGSRLATQGLGDYQGEWRTPRKPWNEQALKLLAGNTHPNLPAVRLNNGVYEYQTIRGETLREAIQQSAATFSERFSFDGVSPEIIHRAVAQEVLEKFHPYFLNVLDGLEFLSQKGFLNDDNHSENIIVDGNSGQAVVIDFKAKSTLSGSVAETVSLIEDAFFTYFEAVNVPGYEDALLARTLRTVDGSEYVVQRDTSALFQYLFGEESELFLITDQAEMVEVESDEFRQAILDEIQSIKGARLVDAWSERINRFLNGVIAVLGNQILSANEKAQVPIELQGRTAIFELTPQASKTIAVSELSGFGFDSEEGKDQIGSGVDVSEARSAMLLRQKLDELTADQTTVSARELATNRALFNQALQSIPRIDSRPVIAVVDLEPFKNLSEKDPRFELMVSVFVNTFVRQGYFVRFKSTSLSRVETANQLALSQAEALNIPGAASKILNAADPNPKDAFEVVLRQQGSEVTERVRDRVFVAIQEIPGDPHTLPELGSIALLMRSIGESVRFEKDVDAVDSDTIHSGLISAINILYDSEKPIGVNEVVWVLTADTRGDELAIGFIRVDNVIMAIRMQNRQVDIMA